MGLRVHRAISWIGRAEAAGDDDARFLVLWIGFPPESAIDFTGMRTSTRLWNRASLRSSDSER